MRRARAWATDDTGSAALEFITVGVILLVPLAYLVIVLGALQTQSFGVEAAARHTARAIALADGPESAREIAEPVLANVVSEYGLDPDSLDVSIDCAPAAGDCPEPGAIVTVTVHATARLPFVPPVLGLDRATAIPVEASSVQRVGAKGAG